MCTPEAFASVESTIAVFVEATEDAVPDTMLSDSTLPRLAGSMAAMPCELPLMITDVPRTSVTSRRLGSFCNACAACVLKSGPWVNTMKSARKAPSIASLVETRTEFGEHRDACDQRKADHQRSCGERCAARIAPSVLTGEYSGRSANARHRPSKHGRDRHDQHWGKQRNAEEDSEKTGADELQLRTRGGEEPDDQRGAPDDEDHHADRDPASRQGLGLGECL